MSSLVGRYIVAVVAWALLATTGYSQIKLVGPDAATPGELTKVQVKTNATTGLKIDVLLNGKPTTQGYSAMKELDDSPVILFYTKNAGTYTVVASGVFQNKPDTVYFVLVIQNPVPAPDVVPTPDPNVKPIPPPVPKPSPKLTGFAQEVYDLYKAEPDDGSLDLLIATFNDTKAFLPNLKTFGDFETSIAATAAKRINSQTKLRKLRDRIGDYLIEKTGSDPRAWNQVKASQVCDDVIAALKGCK